MHECAPVALVNEPAGQDMHLLLPRVDAKKPIAHFVQRCAAVFSVYVPLGQGLHLSCPALPIKWPMGQGVHVDWPWRLVK